MWNQCYNFTTTLKSYVSKQRRHPPRLALPEIETRVRLVRRCFIDQIVQYVGYVDCVDTENGHGTHVGGSAAGGLSHSSPGEHFGDGVSFLAALRRGVIAVLASAWAGLRVGAVSFERDSCSHSLLGRTCSERQSSDTKTKQEKDKSHLRCVVDDDNGSGNIVYDEQVQPSSATAGEAVRETAINRVYPMCFRNKF